MLASYLANLRIRFLLLVLAAVLPTIGLLYVTAAEQRDDAIQAARANNRQIANLAAADQQRRIESTRQLLVVLAGLPEVRAGGERCNALLAELNVQFPLYTNLGVIAPDGMVTCSAVAPAAPTNLGDRAYFTGAVETRNFVVGEYQVGVITNQPSLNCGYPIINEAGDVVGVVYAALNLAALGAFAAEAELPEGAILTVFDRDGTVLVRRPDDPSRVGTSLAGTPMVTAMLGEGSGVIEGEENGETYLYAFSSLGGAEPGNAYLSIAIPRSVIVADAEQAFANNLTRLGLVMVVVLIAAWIGGDLLVRRNTEANKVLVRRIYDSFSSGGVDLLDEVVAADFRDRDPMPGQAAGLPGLKQAVGLFRAAFPDGEIVVDELLADGDKVVARVTLRGTQHGEFFGRSPTDELVSAEGIEVYRIKDGKIVEGWSRFVMPEVVKAAPVSAAERLETEASDLHLVNGRAMPSASEVRAAVERREE